MSSLIFDFNTGTDTDIGGHFIIPEYPDLNIVYKGHVNSLCPSEYGGTMVCFRRGGIAMNFSVNGKDVEIKSEDGKNTMFKVKTSTHKYVFEAMKPYVEGKLTFLVIKITQSNLN